MADEPNPLLAIANIQSATERLIATLDRAKSSTSIIQRGVDQATDNMGGRINRSNNQVFPDPDFTPPTTSILSGPERTAIGNGDGGPQNVTATPVESGGGGGGFRQNLSNFIADNPGAALLYAGSTGAKMLNSAETVVEANLLMQRAAFFQNATGAGGRYDSSKSSEIFASGGSRDYETVRKLQEEFARKGTVNDPMDVMRALAAAQSYGITSNNFMLGNKGTSAGSVMEGISNLSNLLPGAGIEGTTRAYGAMQGARSVNMLRGIGIQMRDEQGNMKPPDQVIDDIWKKISRDYAGAYGSGKMPSEQEVKIGLQPGNSMDSMLNMYFGTDPMLKQMVANGLLYKARTGGGAITKTGAFDAGATTEGVLSKSAQTATASQTLGQVAFRGTQGFSGASNILNFIGSVVNKGDAATGALGALTGGKAFIETLLGGANGGNMDIAKFLLFALGLGKAEGGPVKKSGAYLVGEKGPEIFQPEESGTIIPNHKMGNFGGFRHAGGPAHAAQHVVVGEGGKELFVPDTWAEEMLKRLGVKNTPTNKEAMVAWATAEGGHWNNTAGYNPLNTTLNMKGDTLMGPGPGASHGVRHYKDWEQGYTATVQTLTGTKSAERGYDAILAAMNAGKSVEEIKDVIGQSSWGTFKGRPGAQGGASGTGGSGGILDLATATNDQVSQTLSSFLGKSGTGGLDALLNSPEKLIAAFAKYSNTMNEGSLGNAAKIGQAFAGITINISSADNPKAIASAVKKVLKDLSTERKVKTN